MLRQMLDLPLILDLLHVSPIKSYELVIILIVNYTYNGYTNTLTEGQCQNDPQFFTAILIGTNDT